jgi:hypothetical protein
MNNSFQGATMNGPLDSTVTGLTARGLWPAQRIASPNLASFAKALRQRGLLARAEAGAVSSHAWSEEPDLWIAGNSIYEAHLRRVAMEQVWATLRVDGGEPEQAPA